MLTPTGIDPEYDELVTTLNEFLEDVVGDGARLEKVFLPRGRIEGTLIIISIREELLEHYEDHIKAYVRFLYSKSVVVGFVDLEVQDGLKKLDIIKEYVNKLALRLGSSVV